MPCYVTGSREGDLELNAQEAQTEATKATRLLCSVMSAIDEAANNGVSMRHYLPADAVTWWAKHKKVDAKRKRKP